MTRPSPLLAAAVSEGNQCAGQISQVDAGPHRFTG